MFSNSILFIAASSLLGGSALAAVIPRAGHAFQGTPHDMYSSSIGVLGCLVDTNRIAYWPTQPGCNNICKKITKGDRSVHVLHIDQSTGAYDISFDAWNELVYGVSAREGGQAGGKEDMTFEDVDMSDPECLALLKTESKKLPLAAAASMGYIANCITEHADSWVARNIETYNIIDPICQWGYMEKCELAYPKDNLQHCPEPAGRAAAVLNPLEEKYHVINIMYSDGHLQDAVDADRVVTADQTSGAASLSNAKPSGATFREEDEDEDATPTSTTTVPTPSPSSTITPVQALVILGAMLKNALGGR